MSCKTSSIRRDSFVPMKHTLAALLLLSVSALHAEQPPKGEPTNAAEAAAKKAAADAVVAEKYAALVATLPADQQAWEKVLQEQLGSFYLPIHKSEKVQGRSNAWDFVQDDPKLPRCAPHRRFGIARLHAGGAQGDGWQSQCAPGSGELRPGGFRPEEHRGLAG